MLEKNKPYTVKITETAWEMLISHARFLANVSIPAANRLINTFVEVTDSLAAMPERNPWLEHDAIPFQKYRKLLFCKHYMAIYQIQETTNLANGKSRLISALYLKIWRSFRQYSKAMGVIKTFPEKHFVTFNNLL